MMGLNFLKLLLLRHQNLFFYIHYLLFGFFFGIYQWSTCIFCEHFLPLCFTDGFFLLSLGFFLLFIGLLELSFHLFEPFSQVYFPSSDYTCIGSRLNMLSWRRHHNSMFINCSLDSMPHGRAPPKIWAHFRSLSV